MNVLGRCSKEVEQNIKGLVMRQIQKAFPYSSLHIARMFKLNGWMSIGILDTYFNRF